MQGYVTGVQREAAPGVLGIWLGRSQGCEPRMAFQVRGWFLRGGTGR